MPGTKITVHQVSKYKAERKRATLEIAAAKTGISVRSARRIEQAIRTAVRRYRRRRGHAGGRWKP